MTDKTSRRNDTATVVNEYLRKRDELRADLDLYLRLRDAHALISNGTSRAAVAAAQIAAIASMELYLDAAAAVGIHEKNESGLPTGSKG